MKLKKNEKLRIRTLLTSAILLRWFPAPLVFHTHSTNQRRRYRQIHGKININPLLACALRRVREKLLLTHTCNVMDTIAAFHECDRGENFVLCIK